MARNKPKSDFVIYRTADEAGSGINREYNDEMTVYIWAGDGGVMVSGSYDENDKPFLRVESQHPGGGDVLGEIHPGQNMCQEGWRTEDCLVLGGGGAVYRTTNFTRNKHKITLLSDGGYGVVREQEVEEVEEAKRLFREYVSVALSR